MAKFAARGIDFKRNTTGPTYVSVGQVLSIDPPGSSRALIDASAYGDTWMDYVVGLQEGSEITVTFAFDPSNAQHTAIKGDYDAGVSKNFQLTNTLMTAPTRTATFPVMITSYTEGGSLDGVHTGTVTMKIISPGVTYT